MTMLNATRPLNSPHAQRAAAQDTAPAPALATAGTVTLPAAQVPKQDPAPGLPLPRMWQPLASHRSDTPQRSSELFAVDDVSPAEYENLRHQEATTVRAALSDPQGYVARVRQQRAELGDNAPCAELQAVTLLVKARVREMLQALRPVGNAALLQQVELVVRKLCMTNMAYQTDVDDYPYPAPYVGEFPYRPTLEALLNAVELFDCMAALQVPRTPEGVRDDADAMAAWNEMVARDDAVFLPVTHGVTPDQIAAARQHGLFLLPIREPDAAAATAASAGPLAQFLAPLGPASGQVKTLPEAASAAVVAECVAQEKAVIRQTLKNGVDVYAGLRKRLEAAGPRAPFPEFSPILGYLSAHIGNLLRLHAAASHRALVRRIEIAASRLNAAQDHGNPYRASLEAIHGAMEVFDALAFEDTDPKTRPEPLYHVDRYWYYWGQLAQSRNVVLFPTVSNLGFRDLIRARCAPIGFLGVKIDATFVDRHRQSPLDFLIHDLNHVRRMVGYDEEELRRLRVTSLPAEIDMYRRWSTFTQERLLPLISTLGKSDPDKVMAHMVRLTIFEVLHESAFPPIAERMLSELRRPEGALTPFEHMRMPWHLGNSLDTQRIESLRTPLGNIASGVSGAHFPQAQITVRYFRDRALNLLANVCNKMVFGFYDHWADPQPYVAPVEERTPQRLAHAAQGLLTALGEPNVDLDELMQLSGSRAGSKEKFNYPRVVGTPEA